VSYQLLCQCGRTLTGARQRRHQVIPCPVCGRPTFILPRSAFAPGAAGEPAAPSRRWWLRPVIAGAGVLLLLLLSFLLLLPRLGRNRGVEDKQEPFDIKEAIAKGRSQLAHRRFRLARDTLSEAIKRRDPSALSPAENRELNQLHREADVLSRLLRIDLNEVVQQASLTPDSQEWRLHFDENFRGKGVIFDDRVGRDRQGKPVLLDPMIDAEADSARVAIDDLEELRDLPLDDGPRLVFGARLLSCERERGEGWVIRLEPDSGVLMTELEAVVAEDVKAPDEGLKRALARQRQWLDGRAVIPPARP
jgi:hypothetical protein